MGGVVMVVRASGGYNRTGHQSRVAYAASTVKSPSREPSRGDDVKREADAPECGCAGVAPRPRIPAPNPLIPELLLCARRRHRSECAKSMPLVQNTVAYGIDLSFTGHDYAPLCIPTFAPTRTWPCGSRRASSRLSRPPRIRTSHSWSEPSECIQMWRLC